MDETPYKTRAQGAVDSERMQLLGILAYHWEDLERYENEGGTQKQKWDLWEVIANEFNCNPCVTVTRTPIQVKTLFKNMKTKARKYKVKVDSSKTTGIILEADPVSETVLRLTKYQSKESIKTVLEPLKKIYYMNENRLNTLPTSQFFSEKEPVTSFSYDLSNHQDASKPLDTDDVPNIKEEVIEAFDSPCIIREEFSQSFPVASERSSFSSDDPLFVTEPSQLNSLAIDSSSEVHTFGDLSVTPISSEKRNPSFNASNVATIALNEFNEVASGSSGKQNVTENVSTPQLISVPNPLKRPIDASVQDNDDQFSVTEEFNSQYKRTAVANSSSSGKCGNGGACCCPEYHNQMLAMTNKEHELRLKLLSEEILTKREERKLREEEIKIRQQCFLMKQEERLSYGVEHQARLKLLELECQAVEIRIKNNERTNKWFLRNGSKEI